jgi:hypothetical protein
MTKLPSLSRVITARIVLPNTRKRKPTADVSALFAKIREPQPVEL